MADERITLRRETVEALAEMLDNEAQGYARVTQSRDVARRLREDAGERFYPETPKPPTCAKCGAEVVEADPANIGRHPVNGHAAWCPNRHAPPKPHFFKPYLSDLCVFCGKSANDASHTPKPHAFNPTLWPHDASGTNGLTSYCGLCGQLAAHPNHLPKPERIGAVAKRVREQHAALNPASFYGVPGDLLARLLACAEASDAILEATAENQERSAWVAWRRTVTGEP